MIRMVELTHVSNIRNSYHLIFLIVPVLDVVEVIENIADLAIRLEKYKYAIAAASSWAIMACIVGGALMIATAIAYALENVNFCSIYIPAIYFIAVIIAVSLGVHFKRRLFSGYVPKSEDEKIAINNYVHVQHYLFSTTFIIAYTIASIAPIPGVLKYYLYGTLWYVCYAICFLVLSHSEEKLVKFKLLPINASRVAGIILASTSVLPYLPIFLGLFSYPWYLYGFCLCLGLTLIAHLVAHLLIVSRLNKILYEE